MNLNSQLPHTKLNTNQKRAATILINKAIKIPMTLISIQITGKIAMASSTMQVMITMLNNSMTTVMGEKQAIMIMAGKMTTMELMGNSKIRINTLMIQRL